MAPEHKPSADPIPPVDARVALDHPLGQTGRVHATNRDWTEALVHWDCGGASWVDVDRLTTPQYPGVDRTVPRG